MRIVMFADTISTIYR